MVESIGQLTKSSKMVSRESKEDKKMKIKVIKGGFGKRNFKVFRLNEGNYCFNLFGIALFVSK